MRQGILATWAVLDPKRKGNDVAKDEAAWTAAK